MRRRRAKKRTRFNDLDSHVWHHVTKFLDKRSHAKLVAVNSWCATYIQKPKLTADVFHGMVSGNHTQITEAFNSLQNKNEEISSKSLQSEIICMQSEALAKILGEAEDQWNVVY
jgi:hypothetical protein